MRRRRPSPTASAPRRGSRRKRLGSEFGEETGIPTHVFRLAGIYGPGRSAFDKLLAGTARRIRKDGQVFSRIHVADIASVLEASIAHPRAGAIYNVADDEPAAPDAVVAYAAELLGVPPPPEVEFAKPTSRPWRGASMKEAGASPMPASSRSSA